MKKDIIKFFEPFTKRYGMSLSFIPDSRSGRESYLLHYRGKIVLGVSTEQFYQIPKSARVADIMGRLKLGLNGALDDKSSREQVHTSWRMGKIIFK